MCGLLKGPLRDQWELHHTGNEGHRYVPLTHIPSGMLLASRLSCSLGLSLM